MEKPRTRKSFRGRISKFFLRAACSNTATAPFRRLPRNPQPEPKPSPSGASRRLERHVSFPSQTERPVVQITIDCAGRHSVDAALPSVRLRKKKERRLTETGFSYLTGECEGQTCPPTSPFSPSSNSCTANRRYLSQSERKDKDFTKRLLRNGCMVSSSSSIESENEEDELEFFSSDREKQELISSRSFSFSSESSELIYRNKNILTNGGKFGKAAIEEAEDNSGFAVVKRSLDPYKDFRNSMVEMILERRIKGADDMRRLLESYLKLNSPEHHPTIVSAFADVWDAIFPKS